MSNFNMSKLFKFHIPKSKLVRLYFNKRISNNINLQLIQETLLAMLCQMSTIQILPIFMFQLCRSQLRLGSQSNPDFAQVHKSYIISLTSIKFSPQTSQQ